MQGASPLASPGLNPRGTGSPCRCGKLNGGGLPRRCRLGGRQRYPAGGVPALSPAYPATVVPAGGRACFVACLHCHCGARGGCARFVACLPYLWLVFLPPSPQPPSRREGGDYRFILPGATAPGTPALNRLRHLQFPPYRYPAKRCLWLGAKTTEMLSLGQCRQPRRGGDRGRWNYPSHATAAFEMVLSPGAGIAGDQKGKPPADFRMARSAGDKNRHAPRRAPGTADRADAAPTPQKKYRRPPRFCVSRL